MKVLVQAMWVLFGVLFYFYARQQRLRPWLSGGVVLTFLLSYTVLDLKDSVVSESTYMVLSTATLLFADSVYRRKLDESHPVRFGALLGLLMVLSVLTRITGVALPAAFAVFEVVRFRRIRVFAIAAGAVFVCLFVLYQLTLVVGGGYANHLIFSFRDLPANLLFYLKTPATMWAPLTTALRYALTTALILLAVADWVRRVRNEPRLSEPYVLLYLIPVVLFPQGGTARYSLPVFPFLLLYAAEFISLIVDNFPRRGRMAAWSTVSVVLVLAAVWNVQSRKHDPDPDGPEAQDFQATVQWLRQNTRRGELLVFDNPRVLALYTDRPSAACVYSHDFERVRGFLGRVHAHYFVTFQDDEDDQKWSIPVIREHSDAFPVVYRSGRFTVYRVNALAAAAAAA